MGAVVTGVDDATGAPVAAGGGAANSLATDSGMPYSLHEYLLISRPSGRCKKTHSHEVLCCPVGIVECSLHGA